MSHENKTQDIPYVPSAKDQLDRLIAAVGVFLRDVGYRKWKGRVESVTANLRKGERIPDDDINDRFHCGTMPFMCLHDSFEKVKTDRETLHDLEHWQNLEADKMQLEHEIDEAWQKLISRKPAVIPTKLSSALEQVASNGVLTSKLRDAMMASLQAQRLLEECALMAGTRYGQKVQFTNDNPLMLEFVRSASISDVTELSPIELVRFFRDDQEAKPSDA